MESSVATREAPPEPESSYDGAAEATRSTEELFQWSTYINIGVGAEECEHRDDGECQDPHHFHAWVCLPNTFQIRDIVDKARAAKARRTRALRDPATDAHEVLEAELDETRRERYDALVEAIARNNVDKVIEDVVRGLREDERFEHQAQDAEEYNRLVGIADDDLTDEDRSDLERLKADMVAYGDAVQEEMDKRIKVEVERLKMLPPDDVVNMERQFRIENEAMEVYLHTYYTWTMFSGTRTRGLSLQRKFAKPEDLKNAPPEVIIALRGAVRDLEQRTTVRGDAAGNS